MEIRQIVSLSIATVLLSIMGGMFNRRNIMPAFFLLVTAFMLIAVTFPPSAFVDYSAYVDLADHFRDMGFADLPMAEFFSRALIKLFTGVMGDTESGVNVMAGLVFTGTLVGLGLLCFRYAKAPVNIALVVSLYGTLLAFVTLRASFACLLISILILRGPKYDWKSAAIFVVAAGFHISSLLVIPALALYEVFRRIVAGDGRRCVLTYGIVVTLALFWRFMGKTFLDNITYLFTIFLGATSFDRLDYYLNPENVRQGLAHDLFFAGIIAFGFFLFWIDRGSLLMRKRLLFVAFFSIFALLEVNPVMAFRFSPFFMVPLLIEIDFKKQVLTSGNLPFVILGSCTATGILFLFSFLISLAH